MKTRLREICGECGGQCCQPPIFLGQVDIDRLNSAGKKFKIKKTGKAGFDLLGDGKCPFLKGGSGCTLEKGLKPIDCILYPLAFVEKKDGEFVFYLNKRCPYFNKVPNDWIQKTIKWAKEELKTWSREERETYQKRQMSDLVAISNRRN